MQVDFIKCWISNGFVFYIKFGFPSHRMYTTWVLMSATRSYLEHVTIWRLQASKTGLSYSESLLQVRWYKHRASRCACVHGLGCLCLWKVCGANVHFTSTTVVVWCFSRCSCLGSDVYVAAHLLTMCTTASLSPHDLGWNNTSVT